MINYIITSSSTIDLAPSMLENEKYDLLYFNYTLDNQQYLDDFGKNFYLIKNFITNWPLAEIFCDNQSIKLLYIL